MHENAHGHLLIGRRLLRRPLEALVKFEPWLARGRTLDDIVDKARGLT